MRLQALVPLRRRTCSDAVDDGVRAAGGDDVGLSRRRRRRPCTSALPDAAPGLVEIWPLIKPDEKREIEAWDAPFDALTETSPQVAARGARSRRHVAATGMTRSGARAGDVLVLVRQRGPLFEAIIRALKDADVAVAGADRLVLTEHIAVMDLMALADALLLPEDDLALATRAEEPAVRLRRRRSVRARLGAQGLAARRAAREGRDRAAVRGGGRQARPLRRMGADATRRSRSIRGVLGPERGRQQFFARLGHEADDALDEFLNLALDYERARDAVAAGLRRLAAHAPRPR